MTTSMSAPVALISSTIAPPALEHYGGDHSRYNPSERLEQTRATIQSLIELGVEEIYLADNSGDRWMSSMVEDLRPARVQVFHHHQYRNKGVSELYLLLAALPALPPSRPIIKLSGRYCLKRRLDQNLRSGDLVVRESRGISLLHCYIDTVAYAVRDSVTCDRFLRATLRDVFGFPSRIVGPGSLRRIIFNSLFPSKDSYPYDDPQGDIEHAAWRALRNGRFDFKTIDALGIEGRGGQAGEQLFR